MYSHLYPYQYTFNVIFLSCFESSRSIENSHALENLLAKWPVSTCYRLINDDAVLRMQKNAVSTQQKSIVQNVRSPCVVKSQKEIRFSSVKCKNQSARLRNRANMRKEIFVFSFLKFRLLIKCIWLSQYFTHISSHFSISVYSYQFIHLLACICFTEYIYIYIYMYVCMYVCMYFPDKHTRA